MSEVIGIVSGALALIAFFPYISSVLKHKTKPHPITWIMWTITGFVALVTYWGVGARETIWIAVINFISSFTVAILSIKYWKASFSLFDYICLILSIASVVMWLILDNAALALSLSIVADLIAALPTLRKVYKKPKSESTSAWLIFGAATLLSVFAVEEWSYGVLLLPLYLFFLSLIIVILSLRHARHSS